MDCLSEIQGCLPRAGIMSFAIAGGAGKQVFSNQKLHLSERSDCQKELGQI